MCLEKNMIRISRCIIILHAVYMFAELLRMRSLAFMSSEAVAGVVRTRPACFHLHLQLRAPQVISLPRVCSRVREELGNIAEAPSLQTHSPAQGFVLKSLIRTTWFKNKVHQHHKINDFACTDHYL